jgi:hypothetical protein
MLESIIEVRTQKEGSGIKGKDFFKGVRAGTCLKAEGQWPERVKMQESGEIKASQELRGRKK